MDHKKLLKKKSGQAEVSPTLASLTQLIGALKAVRGATQSNKALRTLAARLIAAARQQKAALIEVGWTEEMTNSLEQALTGLDAVSSSDSSETEISKDATEAFLDAFAKAKAFRRRLVAQVRLAGLSKPEVLATSPIVLGSVRTAANLVKWFTGFNGVMESLRAELESSSSVDWFAQVASQEEALNAAIGLHEQRAAERAVFTEKKVAARNALATMIESLSVHAGVAFVGQPSVLKQFRKRSALARKPKAKEATGGGTASSTSAESTGDPTVAAAAQPGAKEQVKPAAQ